MSVALSTKLVARFEDAAVHAREALAQEGFGVLTEINFKDTLKNKLGVDIEEYLILGACNPALVHRAISINPDIGLLLPCSVLVRVDPGDPGTVIIEAMNPSMFIAVTGEADLMAIADEVTAMLSDVITALAQAFQVDDRPTNPPRV